MASEQARRDNKVIEREVKVEKDRVPKITSHFESMADKGKEHHHEGEGGVTGTHFVSLSDKGSNMVVSDEGAGDTKMKRTQMPRSVGKFVVHSGEKEGTVRQKDDKASLDDIHEYRANAQQKSMDTIRAAEERYNKAKESLSHGGQEAHGKRGEDVQGKARESAVHVTHFGADKGRHSQESARGGRIHGSGGAAAVVGQEARGKAGEERESGVHGEKAKHAQLMASGGAEFREGRGQESSKEAVAKARESVGQGAQKAGSVASEKTQRGSDYVRGKGRETGDVAAKKGQETKEQAARAKEFTMGKAGVAKDIAAEKARRASEYMTEKGRETGNTTAEQAARAKDYTLQKAVEAKDTAAEKAQRASQYVTEKGKEAGNVAAQKGQEAASMTAKAKDYTVDKAGEVAGYVKEVTVEGGKGAAQYAGVLADKAAKVGWTAAHFTTEKVVQATKAVAGTVEGAVGYVGHQTVEPGSKAVDLTKEKAAVAADTVVGYTARKKEEAQHRDQEMHQGGEEEKRPGFVTEARRGHGGEYGGEKRSDKDVFGYGTNAGEARRGVAEEEYRGGSGPEKDVFGYGANGASGETRRGLEEEEYGGGGRSEEDVFGYGTKGIVGEEYGGGRGSEKYVEEGVGAGGVLGAIGETIAEIAETTKNIVIGDEPPMRTEHGTTAPDYTKEEYGHR